MATVADLLFTQNIAWFHHYEPEIRRILLLMWLNFKHLAE